MTEQTAGETTPIEVDEAIPDGSVKETGRESSKNVVSGEDGTRQETALYAATNLESWETDKPHYYARDIGIDGTCFRRLDPPYYAWLRYKMGLAKKAADSEHLSARTFEALRTRFNSIHAWAIERFGEDELLSAIQSLDPKAYPPPALETFGQDDPPSPIQTNPAKKPQPLRGISSRKRATGVSPGRFRRRLWPRWTPSETRPFPSDGAKSGSTRTGDASAFPADRITGSSAFSTRTSASAR